MHFLLQPIDNQRFLKIIAINYCTTALRLLLSHLKVRVYLLSRYFYLTWRSQLEAQLFNKNILYCLR